MTVKQFLKAVDGISVQKLIIYDMKTDEPIYEGDYLCANGAAENDKQFAKDLVIEKDFDGFHAYESIKPLLKKVLGYGLENGTCKVRLDPFVNEHGVPLVNIVMSIKE